MSGAQGRSTKFRAVASVKAAASMSAGHEIAADGLTGTLRLQEGPLFQDNEPVRAVDPVVSRRRVGGTQFVWSTSQRVVVASS